MAKDGRFGVYVTDGETNASIGQGDRLEAMPPERAYELLAVRREQVAEKGGPRQEARPGRAKAAKAAAKPARRRPPAKKPPPAEEVAGAAEAGAAGTAPAPTRGTPSP